MRLARVIGTVTLARTHPTMQGIPLRLVEAVEGFDEALHPVFGEDSIVACDILGSGRGDLIALAEGPEAANPFRPDMKPIDANSAAILDSIEI